MKKLHRVSCQSGYPVYRWGGLGRTALAGDMRYSLVVQAFTIAFHHSASSALPHWQEDVEACQGSLAHLAQSVPSSVTACLRSTWAGFVLTSTADGTYVTSTR